jgi:hypothetical protein
MATMLGGVPGREMQSPVKQELIERRQESYQQHKRLCRDPLFFKIEKHQRLQVSWPGVKSQRALFVTVLA